MKNKSIKADKPAFDKNHSSEQKWKNSKQISKRSLGKVQGGIAGKQIKGAHLVRSEKNI
jgi:hypothetical protein